MVYAKLAGLLSLCGKRKRAFKGTVPLTQIDNGMTVMVIKLAVGRVALQKLAEMGIVPGAFICKHSASFVHGPVVITKGATKVAIGFGLAQKVMVAMSNLKNAV
jgi:ferrous iron transport protein A